MHGIIIKSVRPYLYNPVPVHQVVLLLAVVGAVPGLARPQYQRQTSGPAGIDVSRLVSDLVRTAV